MKFQIKHRRTGSALYEAELATEFEGKAYSVQLGAAVKLAIKSGTDLSGARLSGTDLSGAHLSGANLSGADLSRAHLSGANLSGANLYGTDLSGANLSGTNLSGTNLIDGGHDMRGYRFWAWRHRDGHFVYRAGCREWRSIEDARAHYGDGYRNDGNVPACLARLDAIQAEIEGREWPEVNAKDAT